jgi:peptide-methionine (S)-S-oxide reductase
VNWRALFACGVMLATGAAASQNRPAPAAPDAKAKSEIAIFAGGCFWCVESDFDKVPGVLSTTSGYIGGRKPNPTYAEVSAGGTGYAEAVKVEFDPARVTYAQLVERFWTTIDPTVRDQQFCDIGSQYRTAIFTANAEQQKIAEASKTALGKSKPFTAPIITEIVPAGTFYPAEEYHQDYYLKNPIRYSYYRKSCGRDARLKQLWGEKAGH